MTKSEIENLTRAEVIEYLIENQISFVSHMLPETARAYINSDPDWHTTERLKAVAIEFSS